MRVRQSIVHLEVRYEPHFLSYVFLLIRIENKESGSESASLVYNYLICNKLKPFYSIRIFALCSIEKKKKKNV